MFSTFGPLPPGATGSPYSPLERSVLDLGAAIRAPKFQRQFPAAGADFKIMGCRFGETVTLTLALAFVDRHVQSVSHYFALKQAMHDHLSAAIPAPAQLRINRLDDPQARDESGLHLTVTGLSGEMGGGMVSSTVLTLAVIPALYALVSLTQVNALELPPATLGQFSLSEGADK